MAGPRVAIIGAGPAGLTGAYVLARRGVPSVVLEADPRRVGGLARTIEHRGVRFDIGAHRFFSKSPGIEALWTELLGPDLVECARLTRIHYRGRLFVYPLRATDALARLGLVESARCVLSYLRARVFPVATPGNFEEWVSNQFGRRLFRIFFESYTEKVWGMSCREISADWAAQRIRGLSLGRAVRDALARRLAPGRRGQRPVVKTLVEAFRYPRGGAGMMWERCARRAGELGADVRLGWTVTGCHHDRDRGLW
jgi:protoporphyrinogen oxidase